MKLFKRIWIILLFAGTLSACVKDYPEEIIVPEEETGNGQGQFFSTTISMPMPAATKATRSNNEFYGTYNESLVRGVRIVMYETGSEQVAYSKDIEAFNVWYEWGDEYYYPGTFYGKDVAESDWSGENSVYFITVATDTIVRGNYKMLVLLNPTDRLKAITELGQPLSALYQPATGKSGEPGHITPEDMTGDDFTPMLEYFNYTDYSNETSYTFAYDNFLMLNSQGLVDVRAGDFYKTVEQAQANPVYTGVERAVAKVKVAKMQIDSFRAAAVTRAGTNFSFQVYRAPSYKYNNGSWDWDYGYSDYLYLDYMTWGVDITNRTSYWMRGLANKAGNAVIEKRGDQDRKNFYAKDANFSGVSGKNKTEREKEFNYIAAADVNKRLSGYDDDYVSDPSYMSYVLENTMAAPEQMRDVSTRIVVRAVFGVLEDGDLPTGTSFYVYKKGRADNPYNNANYGDPGTFFIIRPSDLQLWATDRAYLPDGYQTLDYEVNSVPAETVGTAPADFPDLWDNIEAVRARFGGDFDFENPSVESFVVEDLEYHKDGISWYDAPIRHFDDSQESNVMGYGRYGVVRNNVYSIVINYLNNAGSPELPEPKPEPNEKIKSINLNFWVSSWWDRYISYQFGSGSVN